MKNARWLLLLTLTTLALMAVTARTDAGGLGTKPGPPVYVYSADDDVIVRRPGVSFLEVIAFLLAAVGCFFGVAAFAEAKTAQRLIAEVKASKKNRDLES